MKFIWSALKFCCVAFALTATFFSANAQLAALNLLADVRYIQTPRGSACQKVIHDPWLYKENWQTLDQAKFWRKVMNTSPDSIILNAAVTRQVLKVVSAKTYNGLGTAAKNALHSNLLKNNQLSANTQIYATKGRSDFYQPERVLSLVEPAIDVFIKEGVDPWLAQAILLIESPAGNRLRSYAGAYGPFQLMPEVARDWGLVVNEKVDERSDLKKSARAAARLIRQVCIPEAEKILAAHRIPYEKDEIWFRLLTLHVYHAGAGNVKAVVDRIKPKAGGPELIKAIWRTEAAAFRNESQNYSQIALAGMIEMDAYIYRHCKRGCNDEKKDLAPEQARR